MKNENLWLISILILNIISFLGGLLYLLNFNSPLFWNIFGLVILFTIFSTDITVYYLSKTYGSLSRIFPKFAYIYFYVQNTAYLILFAVNFIGYGKEQGQNILFGILVYGAYSSIFIIGGYIVGRVLHKIQKSVDLHDKDVKPHFHHIKRKKIVHGISIIMNLVLLVVAVVMNITILVSTSVFPSLFMLGVFTAMMGTFLGLIFISTTILFVKHLQGLKIKQKVVIRGSFVLGIIVSGICFAPLLVTPSYIHNATVEFDTAFNPSFGGDWREFIDPSLEAQYFMASPFQLTGYFLGVGNPECIAIPDILYFNGSLSNYSVDNGVDLYFNAYLPPNSGIGLPGANSTLIRIHGGGWTIGDKGQQNSNMMNRYFAAQGYCVFDIQYGLNNVSDLFAGIPGTPENVLGNFTIGDMLRHIGNFTYYLEANADHFGANLNSVFISGGSAGGQLTCATALILSLGNYTEFSSVLQVKGQIPFYPANNPSNYVFAHADYPDWLNPDSLVTAGSPPCLIFQGDKDALLVKSLSHRDAYVNLGRDDCAVIIAPFAGHANDLYFSGYYNQVFLYFMERFMYLYH